jgi:3-methyl-2-oxobutanoate hydroxymethyltransferase
MSLTPPDNLGNPGSVPGKVTTRSLVEMKRDGKRIAALTAYDFLMAQALDQSGIDVILVGDSAAMVIQGRHTTVPVTLDQMLYHSQVVAKGVQRALVVGDLPFLSYQVNSDEALRSAGRMVKEALVEAVKVEGGRSIAPTVGRLVEVGIPVMGHLGLTPQSIHKFGTYRVRATEPDEAAELLTDALALQDAGAFAIVVEKVPAALAKGISDALEIPVIGIGAGAGCDGQILVSHDMLGLYTKFHPRFVRRYAELGETMREAFVAYIKDVQDGVFPSEDESY